MKKRTMIAGLVFFVCVMSFLLIRGSMNTKTFDDFIGKQNPYISKIVMFNGSNGKMVSTMDKNKIQKLVKLLKNRSYHKASDQQLRTGFSYSYKFYVGNKEVLDICDLGGMVNVYGTYYNSTIVPNDGIKNFYNSLIIK